MNTCEQLVCRIDNASVPHQRNLPKPNEDVFVVDEERGVFIVLDGITRVHSEYEANPYQSAACDVNRIFLKAVCSELHDRAGGADMETILREAVMKGNRDIREYRSKMNESEWGFYPGTLGIISILEDNRFHYLCAGDCLGVLIRGNAKIFFGEQSSIGAVDIQKVTKEERYRIYCNHPENRHTYTIFNGDDCVPENAEYAFLDLYEGDTVFLVSDGLRDCIKYEKSELLKQLSAEDLLAVSERYDREPFASYGDDKTVVKLSF